jgi:hypothetical protein
MAMSYPVEGWYSDGTFDFYVNESPDWDTFKDLLEEQRNFRIRDFENVNCPDVVWEYAVEYVKEHGNNNNAPCDIVNGLLEKGEYGNIKMFVSPEDIKDYTYGEDGDWEWNEDKIRKMVEDRGFLDARLDEKYGVIVIAKLGFSV